jgi:hypothetical protein
MSHSGWGCNIRCWHGTGCLLGCIMQHRVGFIELRCLSLHQKVDTQSVTPITQKQCPQCHKGLIYFGCLAIEYWQAAQPHTQNEPSCAEEIKLVGGLVFVWCRTEELSTLWMPCCI